MIRIGIILLFLVGFPTFGYGSDADPWLNALKLKPDETINDFTFIGGVAQDGELLLDFRDERKGRIRIAVCNKGRCPSFLDAGNFTLYFKGRETTEALETLMHDLAARFERASPPSIPGETLSSGGAKKGELPPPMSPLISPLKGIDDNQWFFIERSELLVSTLFLVFAFVFFGHLGKRIQTDVGRLDRRVRWIFVLLLVLAAAVRLFAPYKLVMAYTGYRLIQNAWELLYWKYGAGGALLYHVFLQWAGPEVESYVLLNRLLGLGTVALASLWFARYSRLKWAAPVAAFFLGLTPILVLDHVTESNLVPALFFLFGGLYFWERLPNETNRLSYRVAGLAFLLAATVIRPLFVVLIPLIWVILTLGRPDRRPVPLDRKPLKILVLMALAGVPVLLHVLWLAGQLAYAERFETWSGLQGIAWTFREFIGSRSLLYNPWMFPASISFLALCSPFGLRGRLSVWLGLALVSLMFFAAYMVDLPAESLTRLQAPSLSFTALAASLLVASLVERYGEHLPVRVLVMLGIVGALFGAQSYVTIGNLWENNNQNHEERALKRVAFSLPDRPVALVVMRGDTPRPQSVPIEYPDLRFLPPNRQTTLLSIDDFTQRFSEGETFEEVYFYLGMRCYTFASKEPPASLQNYIHPACSGLLNRFDTEKLWSEDVRNLSTPGGYIGYPEKEYLELALYRVKGWRNANNNLGNE